MKVKASRVVTVGPKKYLFSTEEWLDTEAGSFTEVTWIHIQGRSQNI